ncbi:MAG TPA: hypothetical protein VMF65_24840 [Acidimicrobiales bacterium]|nr:hypothetical protein [Acidimicrobiales bacterium]
MDASVVPAAAPGRRLAWLMGLPVEPTVTDIQAHLPVAAEDRGLGPGLLAFATTARALPGQVTHSDDTVLRLVFHP